MATDRGDPAGWEGLFQAAFSRSRNAMILTDDRRHIVDVNAAAVKMLGYSRREMIGRPTWDFVEGGPALSAQEWARELAVGRFAGEVEVICADGSALAVQWGAETEAVTGRRLVLLVAINTSRWGDRFRRDPAPNAEPGRLSPRELQIIRMVALGASGPEIAEELQISHDTVRTHVRNAMEKLNARSRAHLVAKALAEGHALA